MTRLAALAAATLLPASLAFAQATRPADAELPVRQVTLFSSGVGYFEHAGTIDGDAGATLRFGADQVDDLLKSLVLQDLGGGTVRAVTYPSAGPLDRQLASFQLDLGGDASLVGLLRQLKGAELTLDAGPRGATTGTVVGVDVRTVAEGDATIEKPFVTLFTGRGLTSVAVSDVQTFEIADERLRQELGRALDALSRSRDKDKRAVNFEFAGDGERRVRLGYVVEAPVWKTSYRLILPENDGEATLQGWAIVENQTDNDWRDARLSLISGRPISFEMDLSTPLFVERPTVEVPQFASLTPKAYAGGTDREADEAAQLGQQVQMERAAMRAAPAVAADAAPAEAMMDREMDMAASVQGVSDAAELGEYFEYQLGGVTIPRQSSAMLPVIADPVGAERVALYDPRQLRAHPLNAAILTNTTGKPLLAGPVTVYEVGGYAGDAQVDDVPAGGERFVTYGVDLKVEARVEPGDNRTEVVAGRISRGVLTVERRQTSRYVYVFENTTDAPRPLVIEHPYDREFELIVTPEPSEVTADARRFRVELPPGESSFTVTARRTTDQQIALIDRDFGADQLLALSRGGGLPDDVRDALEKAADLRRAVATAEEELQGVTNELARITEEQKRLRENLESVNEQGPYYNRLIEKLDAQETQIEELQKRAADLRNALEERRAAYRDYLSNLSV